jgi:hypothetical protein
MGIGGGLSCELLCIRKERERIGRIPTVSSPLTSVAYAVVVPALRKVREERGTHSFLDFSKIKAPDGSQNFTPYVEYTVEWIPHMEIVQIVLDKKLLHAADQAAKRTKRNRSALVRDALREHLRRLELRASEERDRQGYLRHSLADAEARGWEAEAAWPEE